MYITNGIEYENIQFNINNKILDINIIKYKQNINQNLTLLLSKVSEAVNPNQPNNQIGEGSTMDDYLKFQDGVRFIINGGFSHYRKNFYDWSHQDYNIGDPVGLVKIRQHLFNDYVEFENYGFLVQKDKGDLWLIKKNINIEESYKYILGCTPLLIFNKEKLLLSLDKMKPMEKGKINPPSVLGHGLQNHPRTAVGEKNGCLYFITVSQNDKYEGCTLLDLQEIGINLELEFFLNLDGGGSSQYRLMEQNKIIKNFIKQEDECRILGHLLVIFDESLKNKS